MLRPQKVILFHMQEKQTMYKNTALVLEGGGMMFAPGQGGNQSSQGGNSSGSCSTNMAGGLIDTDSGFSITGGVLLLEIGTSNDAFKPNTSGSMIVYGGDVSAVAQVDVSDMTEIALPNGMTYYEK